MIVMNRVPSLEEITKGLQLPAQEGISPATAERITVHNAAVADLANYVTGTSTAVDDAVNAVGDDEGDMLALGSAIENRRYARTDSYSHATRLWRERTEIAEAMAGDLEHAVSEAEKAHATATEKAIELLAVAGLTTAEMPAAQHNGRTAEIQLDGIVRQCRPVRNANVEVTNAKARLDAARQQVTASKNGEATAKSATRAMAERMAAVV